MRSWLAVGTLLVCVAVVAVWSVRTGQVHFVQPESIPSQGSPIPEVLKSSGPSPTTSVPTPDDPTQRPSVSPSTNDRAEAPGPSTSFVGTLNLIIPVTGVRPEQLLDTFSDARSEGRTHDAIDIPAPGGTPVLAAADGEVVKLLQNERGGTTIYQLSSDRKLAFYYAHLQSYAANLHEGQYLHQGEVIAYVGDTGNAGAGNFHLHFSIAILSDPKRYWDGININPYPLLRR